MTLHSVSTYSNPYALQAHGVKQFRKGLQNKIDMNEIIDIINHGGSPLALAGLFLTELDPRKHFRGQKQYFFQAVIYWEVCTGVPVLC